MNKKMTLIATLAAATLSMAGFPDIMWDPTAPVVKGSPHKVCAGYSDEETAGKPCSYNDDAGWWFDYDDRPAPTSGNSYVAALGGERDEYDSFIKSNIIANDSKAIAVEFTNLAGYDYPFSGIGFKLQADGKGQDLTGETGLCFVYNANENFTIEFESSVIKDDAHYMVQFSKGSGVADVTFSKTTQPDWTKTEVANATAFASITQIKFKRGNDDGGVGTTRFQISQIGNYGKCTASPYTSTKTPTPVLNVQAASSVKMQLASRTLSFAGLSSAADVQVINFQGQVVRSATLSGSKSLNLSSLDNGVYLVRVAGQNVSFSQKIVLK